MLRDASVASIVGMLMPCKIIFSVDTAPHPGKKNIIFPFSCTVEGYPKKPNSFQFLSAGNFNAVYLSKDKKTVMKIPYEINQDKIILSVVADEKKPDNPKRAARIWNSINKESDEAVAIYDNKGKAIAWTAPYIQGKNPTDKEIAQFVLEMYYRHDRIFVDAICKGNIIKNNDQKLVCLDISFLLRLSDEEDKKSESSRYFWFGDNDLNHYETHYNLYLSFFKENEKEFPETIPVLRALLFLQQHRPFFKEDFDSCEKFIEKLKSGFSRFYFFSYRWIDVLSDLYQNRKNANTLSNFNNHFPLPKTSYDFCRQFTGITELSDDQILRLNNSGGATRAHLAVMKILKQYYFYSAEKCVFFVSNLSHAQVKLLVVMIYMDNTNLSDLEYSHRVIRDNIKVAWLYEQDQRLAQSVMSGFECNFDYTKKLIFLITLIFKELMNQEKIKKEESKNIEKLISEISRENITISDVASKLTDFFGFPENKNSAVLLAVSNAIELSENPNGEGEAVRRVLSM